MYYVYEWYIEETKEIFYVGKGSRKRYLSKQHNKKFKQYINSFNCKSRIIEYFADEQEAYLKEFKRIKELKKLNQCKCNILDGGVGGGASITHKTERWTAEEKDKYSKNNVMKDIRQRERMSINNPMKNPIIAKKVSDKLCKPFYIGETKYRTLKEASKKYNVADTSIEYWLQRGYNFENNLCYYVGEQKPNINFETIRKVNLGHHIIYKDKEYISQKELAQELNITQSTMIQWIKCGFDNEENPIRRIGDTKEYIFNPYNYKGCGSKICYKGTIYNSVNECSKIIGLKPATIRLYIRKHKDENNYYVNQKPSNRNQ